MNSETIGGSTSISTTGNIATTGTGTLTVAGNTSLSTVSTSGLATLNSLTTASATITGGTIDGTAIGSTNPSTGAFTNLTSTGNTNINTPASAGIVVATTNIDAGPGQEGVVNIGNNGGATPADSSTTNIAGALNISGATNFTGPVNIPAGDLNLGLAQNNIFVGNSSNAAAPYAPVANSVLITSGTGNLVPTWATTLPSGLTAPDLTASSTTGTAALTINSTGVGNDVTGTGGLWDVTNSGAATFASVNAGTGAITNTGNAQIGNGPGTTNSFGTGNSDGNTIGVGGGFPSSTTIAGNVDLTGTVSFTTPPTIPLTNGDIFFGIGGDATAAQVTQDVTLTNAAGAAQATVNSASGSTFTVSGDETINGTGTGLVVTNNATVGGTLGVTGNTSLSTVSTSGLATLNSLTTSSATITGGTINGTSIGATTPSTGVFTNATTTGNTNISTPATPGVTGTTDINNGTGDYAGSINIGNNGAAGFTALGDSSTTNINGDVNLTGNVDFTGTVKLPAGSVSASSLSLTTSHLFVGNGSSDAEDVGMTGDAGIVFTAGTPDVGKVTVSAASGATGFTVTHATQLNGALGVTGQTTLGSTGLSSQGITAAATTALNANGSFFQLTCASSVAITTLTGANATAGQIIVLLNANASGSGIYITLTAGGTLALNGGNVIMGPGGSATLISDGTNWHLMSAE